MLPAAESASGPPQPLFWRVPRVIRFVIAALVPFLVLGLSVGRMIPKDYTGITGGVVAVALVQLWEWAERRHRSPQPRSPAAV